jgi:2-hydroxymuconate-semialdehyde hydrolase
MHGVGPGASVLGAFANILPFLARHFHVFGMDFVGFGASSQKPSPPYFDFELWVSQAHALTRLMPAGDLFIFGHSLSGAIALRLAAELSRVKAVITTGTAGTQYPLNKDLERLWTYPTSPAELRECLRSLIFDERVVSDTMLGERWAILSSGDYGSYFAKMFSGDKQRLMDSWVIPDDTLRAIDVPVTLVHGRNDLPCPPESTSLRLAERIRRSDVVLLSRCGHAPSMEQPRKVMAAVELAFGAFVDFDSMARDGLRSI